MRKANISIDSVALRHNFNEVRRLIPPATKILAMLKANAYGHGVTACLSAISNTDYADGIGVACLSEARELRQLGWNKTLVLIEGVFSIAEWQQALDYDCQCVVHHQQQLQWVLSKPPKTHSTSTIIWLKVNTGMNRLGFLPEQVLPIAKQLITNGYQIILTSHFANADDINCSSNQQQIATFKNLLNALQTELKQPIKASLCNSAGIINFPDCHFDWVRPGIMLYGSNPLSVPSLPDSQSSSPALSPAKALTLTDFEPNKPASIQRLPELRAVMRLQASIMALHMLNKGEAVGYGSRFIASKPLLKAIVSIGYGDGYPRVVNNSAWVAVRLPAQLMPIETDVSDKVNLAYRCPIIGRISMDMLAINVMPLYSAYVHSLTYRSADNSSGLYLNSFINHYKQLDYFIDNMINAEVILWGDSNNTEPSVDEVAAAANTISYELLCRLTNRPTRTIKDANPIRK